MKFHQFSLQQFLYGGLIILFISLTVQYFYLTRIANTVPDPTEMCIAQIKNVGQTAIKLGTKFKFIGVYEIQTNQLISSMLNNHCAYYYLIEGASKQGKSTMGQNLFNKLIQKPDVLALYIPLDDKDPENIFKKMDKCSWNNFEFAVDSIQRENQNVQIIIIVDNIQHTFENEK